MLLLIPKEDPLLIEITNLSKTYGGRTCLSEVSVKLYSQKSYGVVATDHASRRLFLELLAGAVLPSGGSIRINGFDLLHRPVRAKRCLGYAPADFSAFPDAGVEELLRFVVGAKGVPFERGVRQIKDAVEICGLEGMEERLVAHLNAEEKALLALAQAMLGNPEILILDLPDATLPAVAWQRLSGILHSLARMGKTLILGASRLSSLEPLCERMLLLSEGRLVAEVPVEELDSAFDGRARYRLSARATRESLTTCLSSIEEIESCRILPSRREGVCELELLATGGEALTERIRGMLADAEISVEALDMTVAPLSRESFQLPAAPLTPTSPSRSPKKETDGAYELIDEAPEREEKKKR